MLALFNITRVLLSGGPFEAKLELCFMSTCRTQKISREVTLHQLQYYLRRSVSAGQPLSLTDVVLLPPIRPQIVQLQLPISLPCEYLTRLCSLGATDIKFQYCSHSNACMICVATCCGLYVCSCAISDCVVLILPAASPCADDVDAEGLSFILQASEGIITAIRSAVAKTDGPLKYMGRNTLKPFVSNVVTSDSSLSG
jgi:hypothetical protein